MPEDRVTYKGQEYYKGTDGRIREIRKITLEEKVKRSQANRRIIKTFGLQRQQLEMMEAKFSFQIESISQMQY